MDCGTGRVDSDTGIRTGVGTAGGSVCDIRYRMGCCGKHRIICIMCCARTGGICCSTGCASNSIA